MDRQRLLLGPALATSLALATPLVGAQDEAAVEAEASAKAETTATADTSGDNKTDTNGGDGTTVRGDYQPREKISEDGGVSFPADI